MTKYGWRNNDLIANDLTIKNDLSIAGDLSFGDAVTDSLVVKGRISTSTVAGASLDLGASYSYGEGQELRYKVSAWTGVGSSFKAIYLRSEATLGGAYGLRGMEIYGVMNTSTTTGLSNLQCLYTEMLVKASASNRTLTGGNSIEANISLENQTGTLTITYNIYCLHAKAQSGTGVANYTKINGIKISGRDDGTPRVFGIALDISDPEATVCTWTTGIKLATAAVTGISITGAVTRGIDFATGAVATSTNRSKSALSIGLRGSTAYTVTMATTSAAQHLDPVQFNIAVAGVDPGASTTINTIYSNIEHSTANMANLRLKCADWNIVVKKNVLDSYVYQGELDFATNAVVVGGEACAMGLIVDGSTVGVTGNVWGAIIAMAGSGLPAATSAILKLDTRASAVVTHGVYIEVTTGTTLTNALYINNAGTSTNFLKFSTDAAPVGAAVTACGGSDKSLLILVNATPYYIPLYNSLSS